MTALLDRPTTVPTDHARGAELDPVLDPVLDAVVDPVVDVAGELEAELAQQRIGEQVAIMTGAPGVSTVHCLTVSTDEEMLPTM